MQFQVERAAHNFKTIVRASSGGWKREGSVLQHVARASARVILAEEGTVLMSRPLVARVVKSRGR